MCEEMEVRAEQKQFQEEQVLQCLGKHVETLGTTERKIEAIPDKLWKLSQISDTKGMNLEQDWSSFLSLAKDHGWKRHLQGSLSPWGKMADRHVGRQSSQREDVEHQSCTRPECGRRTERLHQTEQ